MCIKLFHCLLVVRIPSFNHPVHLFFPHVPRWTQILTPIVISHWLLALTPQNKDGGELNIINLYQFTDEKVKEREQMWKIIRDWVAKMRSLVQASSGPVSPWNPDEETTGISKSS